MKNLTIYVGKNVNSLKFTQGGRTKGLINGELFMHMTEDTFRECPYGDQHDATFCETMVHDLSYTLPIWNMHISTHKACLMNLIGDLIDNGILDHESVKIILLDEQNNKVSECGYTEDGYLSEGWYAGFMDSTGEEWKKFKSSGEK